MYVPPKNISNYDETYTRDDSGEKKLLTLLGSKKR